MQVFFNMWTMGGVQNVCGVLCRPVQVNECIKSLASEQNPKFYVLTDEEADFAIKCNQPTKQRKTESMQEQSYSCVCLVKADGWKRRSFKNLLWMNDDRDHFTYVQYFFIILSGFRNFTENSHNICQ